MIAMILPHSPDACSANAAGEPLPLIPRRANSASRTKCSDMQNNRPETPSNIVPKALFETATAMQSLHPSGFHPIVLNAPNKARSEKEAEMTNAVQHEQRQNELVQGACTNPIKSRDTCLHSPFDCEEGTRPDHSIPVKQARLVRKKSGQLVKPSLKSPSSYLKADSSVVTPGKSSKSEPTTPTLAKAVHFDTQLEHVKLFLSQQKPLAVSRDGSPTDDTSGTEGDFPSFIYHSCNDERKNRAISMHVTNMPLLNRSLDVALETLSLTSHGLSLAGKVRLRNIAYNKVLAVRFTFDNWSTMNEVTGRYLEPIDAEFDRFGFDIGLRNLLLDGKILIFALRYAVNGREIWDNNMGQNYIASFSRSFINEDEDIDPKLGNASDNNPALDVPRFLKGDSFEWRGRRSPRNGCDDKGPFAEASVKSLPFPFQNKVENIFKPWRSTSSLSSTPGKAQTWGVTTVHQLQECPVSGNNVLDIPTFSLGSPRDFDSDTFQPAIRITFDIDDIAFDPVPSTRVRNHQRSYFDSGWQAPNVRTTPVASLFNSVPLPDLGSHSLTHWGIEHSRSEHILEMPPFGPSSQQRAVHSGD